MPKLIAIKTIMTTDKKERITIPAGDEFETSAAEAKKLITSGAAKEFIEEADIEESEEDPKT